VITVRPDTGVSRLARLLLDNQISAVPIVDDQGRLVGIVSEGTVARLGVRRRSGISALVL
jgi:CBS domain-containing protein